jgi:hypothetical protein
MTIERQNSAVMLRLSTKQKREVYSLSNLLLHLIAFIVLLISLNSCGLLHPDEDAAPNTCDTFATIKDLRGLDGCGFVFVLDNGQRLEPVYPNQGWCTVTQDQRTPLENFDLADGKRVKIGYIASTRPSICMAGKTVEITCITEVSVAPVAAN